MSLYFPPLVGADEDCTSCRHPRETHRVIVTGPEPWCISRGCTCQRFEDGTDGEAPWKCDEHDGDHTTREDCIAALRDSARDEQDEANDRLAEADRLNDLASDLEREAKRVVVGGRVVDDIKAAWA